MPHSVCALIHRRLDASRAALQQIAVLALLTERDSKARNAGYAKASVCRQDVNDTMAPFLSWLKESGKYDMASMVTPKASVSWKTAPDIDWLCELHPLFMKLLKVAKASILPSKNLKSALEKIQREVGRVNFSKTGDDVFFDQMDTYVRIAAGQLRALKKKHFSILAL